MGPNVPCAPEGAVVLVVVPKAPVDACENCAAELVEACAAWAVGDAAREGWMDGVGVWCCDTLASESVSYSEM